MIRETIRIPTREGVLAAAQAKRKGVNVKKKEKVELDDARLPPLHEVLDELELDAAE